jgi:hypothetical protein
MSKTSNTVVATPQQVAPAPAPEFSVPYNVTSKVKVSPYYTSFIDSYGLKYDEMVSYAEVPAAAAAPSYTAPAAPKAKKAKAKKALAPGSVKKRGILVLIVLVLMAVVLAVGALGYIGLEFTNDYVGIFKAADKDVYFHDPIFGAIEAWASDYVGKLGDSVYYDNYLSTIQTENIAIKISLYVLPAALVLIAIFAVIVVIKALMALFGKKPRKLGFLSLLTAIFGLFVAGCGVIWNNMGISEIINVFTMNAANVNAAYGLYALIGLPFIAAILSAFAYKKIK